MEVTRKLQFLWDNGWNDIEWADVKPGLIVRMFEDDGTPVQDGQKMLVVSEPYEYKNENGAETLAFEYENL